jgi:excisionase family DNA binding protein
MNKVSTMDKELLSVTEVAVIKKTSRKTVYKAMADKKINFEEIGNRSVIINNRKFKDWEPKRRIK